MVETTFSLLYFVYYTEYEINKNKKRCNIFMRSIKDALFFVFVNDGTDIAGYISVVNHGSYHDGGSTERGRNRKFDM